MIVLDIAGRIWECLVVLVVCCIFAGAIAAAVHDWREKRRSQRADVQRVMELRDQFRADALEAADFELWRLECEPAGGEQS